MILGFSTQLNGKPTYFVERIWASIHSQFKVENEYLLPNVYFECLDKGFKNMHPFKPKLHTIREDKNDRWQPGTKIDFFINCRQKNMFRFAPFLPVVSVQEVYMSYRSNDLIQISVNERELFGFNERLEFAQNDGFDTWEDFFNYFYPQIKATPNNFLKMKLIHWTDKQY